MELNLSKQDVDFIARVAETEVDHRLKTRNPAMYQQMTAGVIDTILNRVVSPSYPNTVSGVVNQKRQFSKIAGPKTYRNPKGKLINLNPYGTVQNAPKANKSFQASVEKYIQQRASGAPSSVSGHLNYANPYQSSRNNLGWISKLDGPKFGLGKSIHHHGTPNWHQPVGDFKINLDGNVPMLAYNNQSLPTANKAPLPVYREGPRYEVASLNSAPFGQVQREGLGPVNPSPLPSAPSGNVIRAGSLPKATPPTEVNPKARLLQAAYQKRNVPTPVARPADIPKPTYTPKASDYSNYMMNVKQPTLPTPAVRPTDLANAPQVVGNVPIPAPTLEREKLSRFEQGKRKFGNHIKEQLKPETIAARGAGALIGGLLGGPLGARAGSMFGPKIAQTLNRRNQGGLFGVFNNQSNQAPVQTGAQMGSSSSDWGSSQNFGATYSASDGATITGLGNGTYARTNPKTGGTSYWNEDGSRSTKGY